MNGAPSSNADKAAFRRLPFSPSFISHICLPNGNGYCARTMGVVLFQIRVDECQEGGVEDVVHLLDLLEGHWVDAVVTGFCWHIIGVAYAAVETIP